MSSDKHASKFISLILRHDPAQFGVTLDEQGWTDVDALLQQMATHGTTISRTDLQRIVAESDKQRFALSQDGQRIRANQGHSVSVDLGLRTQTPPDLLYHGTAEKNLQSIMETGLQKRERHHVHLSADEATARNVGSRHGKPVVLRVDAAAMHRDGHVFHISENGVWLTDNVPAAYLLQQEA